MKLGSKNFKAFPLFSLPDPEGCGNQCFFYCNIETSFFRAGQNVSCCAETISMFPFPDPEGCGNECFLFCLRSSNLKGAKTTAFFFCHLEASPFRAGAKVSGCAETISMFPFPNPEGCGNECFLFCFRSPTLKGAETTAFLIVM